MADYISAAELAERTGFTARYFRGLAEQGRIDWAFQPDGEGGRWKFELAGFERWWEAGRSDRRQKTFSSAVLSGGGGKPSKAKSTASALKQRLSEKHRAAMTQRSQSL